MSGYKKFDPHAFLERERLAPDSTETLAALATLAGPKPENEIRGTELKILFQCDSGALTAKAIQTQRDDDGVEHGLDQLGKNQSVTPTPAKAAKVAKVLPPTPIPLYRPVFERFESQCPDFVETGRWQQAVEDGRQFLASWGEQAQAFGWTPRELFGLHTPPEQPTANYSRLSRYDETGLIWLLLGRPVIALTETIAAIQGATAVLTYRKLNKPALGPLGDSLDDWGTIV